MLTADWIVKSPGIGAHGVNSNTINAIVEVGIDISDQTSDLIDTKTLNNATLVVTLCGDAADKCPMTPSHVRREHSGFEVPAKATGTDEEKWAFFQNVRDAIRKRIEQFVAEQQK